MDFLDKKLEDYISTHTGPESELLKKIDRHTHVNVIMPRMLSGHLQGRVLSMLSHMVNPEKVLEIGTYTGYSAICLSEGLQDGGVVDTIDVNEELEDLVRMFLKEGNLEGKIKYHIGNALELVPTLPGPYDLVFIDADKVNYSSYFDLVIDKVREGGFIIADNVLWSGKVLTGSKDKDTQAVIDFNNKVHNDSRVENVLFPIRDGLMVLRKV